MVGLVALGIHLIEKNYETSTSQSQESEQPKENRNRSAFAGSQQLLQDKLNRLESSGYIINEKIEKLRNQYIRETREEEKFRLTSLIDELEKDQEKIKQDIDSLRNQLSNHKEWEYELSHQECLKLVKNRRVYEAFIRVDNLIYGFSEVKAEKIEAEREKLENEKKLEHIKSELKNKCPPEYSS